MSLQRLSLGISNKSIKYKTEIKKYSPEEYILTISDSSECYPLVSDCCITDLDYNILECFLPDEENIEECCNLFSSILMSSLFYEAICRTGTPLSFLTDNIDIINEFISLCYNHWQLPHRCHPSFYIPTISCTSKEFICRTEYKLKGDNASALIGFERNKVMLQIEDNEIYFIRIPEVFDTVDENEGLPRLLRYAFMWILLASKEFEVGYGDNIKIKNNKHKTDVISNKSSYNHWL